MAKIFLDFFYTVLGLFPPRVLPDIIRDKKRYMNFIIVVYYFF